MGSYLLVLWSGGGNVGPFLCLADHLLRRGHRVGAVAPASLQERLTGVGVEMVGATEEWMPGVELVLTSVERFRPDALVVDFMLTGALGAAERSGQKTVALVHTLYRALLDDGAPWPIRMAAPLATVNETREGLGLAPVASFGEILDRADLTLVSVPRDFDTPGEVPDNVVYAGALLEPAGPDDAWQPPRGDGPLVVGSLGTAGDGSLEVPVLRRVLAALGQLPVRGFVTVANYIDRSRLEPPDNVTLSAYVRHAAVMPHTDLFVTHGGMGSLLVALSYGVPVVALPLQREQPDNAQAVARLGGGRVLDSTADVDEIASAVSAQLKEPRRVLVHPDPTVAIRRLEELAAR